MEKNEMLFRWPHASRQNECFSSNSDTTHDLCPGRYLWLAFLSKAFNVSRLAIVEPLCSRCNNKENRHQSKQPKKVAASLKKKVEICFSSALWLPMRLILIWRQWKVWNISSDSCNATIPLVADEFSRNPFTRNRQQLAAPSTNECTEAQKERFAFFFLSSHSTMSLYHWNYMNLISFYSINSMRFPVTMRLNRMHIAVAQVATDNIIKRNDSEPCASGHFSMKNKNSLQTENE